MYTGYRSQDSPFQAIDFEQPLKFQYAISIVYSPCICLVKASFLWSLYKLRSRNPWIRRTIIRLPALNSVFLVCTVIITTVPCLPIAKTWDTSLPGGCYDPIRYATGNVLIVLITDARHDRVPVTGFIVIAIGIARLFWPLEAFRGKTNSHSVNSAYSAIECSVAIIGTCGPTIKYILSRCIPAYGKYGKYGNHSHIGATKHARKGGGSANNDLDQISFEHENIELKGYWRMTSVAHSDEQRITADAGQRGIVKSV
ncbi:hypothetical protein EK21DRAFT_103260 [Setomelanomma holmii]|uniref:Rhodopsin domain-containing protein n=1 Tax=Setomelanomma holmii TaxID=210430 RepID=A0A9P4H3E9_9PLEO|nr:hypothetical protein EK21DRAFT_103260 [Setomelanomma holmii]